MSEWREAYDVIIVMNHDSSPVCCLQAKSALFAAIRDKKPAPAAAEKKDQVSAHIQPYRSVNCIASLGHC